MDQEKGTKVTESAFSGRVPLAMMRQAKVLMPRMLLNNTTVDSKRLLKIME